MAGRRSSKKKSPKRRSYSPSRIGTRKTCEKKKVKDLKQYCSLVGIKGCQGSKSKICEKITAPKTDRRRSSGRRSSGNKGPIFIVEKGLLGHYGYENVMKLSLDQRRKALRKAVNDLGANTIIKKLNAVSILNKNRNPDLSRRFAIDRDWVSANY